MKKKTVLAMLVMCMGGTTKLYTALKEAKEAMGPCGLRPIL